MVTGAGLHLRPPGHEPTTLVPAGADEYRFRLVFAGFSTLSGAVSSRPVPPTHRIWQTISQTPLGRISCGFRPARWFVEGDDGLEVDRVNRR